MISIAIARIVNTKSGGAVIAPWQVDQLDTDWVNAFMSQTPDMVEAHNKRVENIKSEFYRRNLPRYQH